MSETKAFLSGGNTPGSVSDSEPLRSPQLLPTPASSPTTPGFQGSRRSSSIHLLLWPSNSPASQPGEANSPPASRCISVSSNSQNTAQSCAVSNDDRQTHDQLEVSPTWSNFTDSLTAEELNGSGLLTDKDDHESIDSELAENQHEMISTYSGAKLADFTAFADPGIRAILKHQNARLLLNHYLHRSIATLHPQLGCSERNTSGTVFLPYCLLYPVALEAILAFSASQLSMEDSHQDQALLYHKTCSIKHLNRLVYQQAFPIAPDGRIAYSLELVVSVLSQISISVSESGTATWQMHCDAAYSILAGMPKPNAAQCSRELSAYLYARMLKYICFAEIAKPSNRGLDLSLIEGSNLTIEFGVPSGGLKLAVMISRYAYMRDHDTPNQILMLVEHEIHEHLHEYLALETYEHMNMLTECQLMNVIWRTTIWLYYYRTVFETDIEHDTSYIGTSRLIDYLRLMPPDSLYATALAFPIQTVVPLITKHNHDTRVWLINFCKQLARSTKTRNFLKIGEFSTIIWAAMDRERCRTAKQVQLLAQETDYVILAA